MNTNRIAEFCESDDALRFAHMKGADYTVCGGIHLMWAVRPKAGYEMGLGDPFSPPERVNEDEEQENDDGP